MDESDNSELFAEIAQSIATDLPLGAEPLAGSKEVSVPKKGAVLRYSPELMVDLMVNNPDLTSQQLAETFGRSLGWFSQVIASQAFQSALDGRRHEVLNPEFSLTLEERFRGLTLRSLTLLQEKMEVGKVLPDMTVMKIAEIGIKALGMGQKVAEKPTSPEDSTPKNSSEMIADRIMTAMAKRKEAQQSDAVDVEAREIKE